MRVDSNFSSQIKDDYRLTTIQIIYRLPDYQSILQEFIWQTLDCPPKYPRMYQFLEYWEEHIEAPIYSVKIANVEVITPGNYQLISKYYKLH